MGGPSPPRHARAADAVLRAGAGVMHRILFGVRQPPLVREIEADLISELGLEPLQARTYLLVTCSGRMPPGVMAENLGVPAGEAEEAALALVDLGAFIEMPGREFEAMHPRFTAVNMFKRVCARKNIKFGRNNTIDAIGAALEKPYDDARSK